MTASILQSLLNPPHHPYFPWDWLETYSRYPTPDMTVTYAARGKSMLNLQGVIGLLRLLTTLTSSSSPRSEINVIFLPSLSVLIRCASVGTPRTLTYLRLSSLSINLCSRSVFPATRHRKMTASTMRKIQVPA